MKQGSSDLHDLIHSLSKSEKRYVRLQTDARLGESLMDAILSERTYDEKEFKKKFANEAFIKNLAVNKIYLYEFILKVLDRFTKYDVLEDVKKGAGRARILVAKGLYSGAKKQVQKYKKKAYANELFEQVVDLLKIEKQLLSLTFKSGEIDAIFEEEESCLDKISNTNSYWLLAAKVYELQMKYPTASQNHLKEQLLEIAKDPKLQNENLTKTSQSKMFFYQANSTFHFMNGAPAKALHFNQLFLQFFESEANLLKRFPERYLSTLNNYLIDSLQLKNYPAFKSGLSKMRQVPQMDSFKKIKNIEIQIFRQCYLLEINWRLSTRDYKNGILLIPELEVGLEKFGSKIEKHHRLTFYYLAASLHFGQQQYPESLVWINKILKDTREKIVQEIYQFARLFNLLIHDGLNNRDLLISLLPTTRRYLREKRPLYKSELLIFKFLRKKINEHNTQELQSLKKKFREDITKLRQNPNETIVFNYIDFDAWLNKI